MSKLHRRAQPPTAGAEIDALRHSHRHVTDAIKPDGHFRYSNNRLLFPSGLVVVEMNDHNPMHHDRRARKYGVETGLYELTVEGWILKKKRERQSLSLSQVMQTEPCALTAMDYFRRFL
jgi:hypothetical protein